MYEEDLQSRGLMRFDLWCKCSKKSGQDNNGMTAFKLTLKQIKSYNICKYFCNRKPIEGIFEIWTDRILIRAC